VPPYWPKWRQFAAAFAGFYADVDGVTFTPDEPWTLFEMPDLGVVVAGLNSTMAEGHRDSDHYGWVGEDQLRWFADRLADYRERGWLRLAAVHHNVVRGAVLDDENLRDADDLDRILGVPEQVNLLLHGHTHDGRLHRLSSGLVALSTGSAAVTADARPAEVPNQYQLVTIDCDGFTRYARQYAVGRRQWIGDTRISARGSDWRERTDLQLRGVHATFHPDEDAHDRSPRRRAGETPDREPGDEFLERVASAARARDPEAEIVPRPDAGYLRVTMPLPSGGIDQWPVGVVDGPLTEKAVDEFADGIHARFAAADPTVRSLLVYAGRRAAESLLARARRRGLTARSFVQYQGLLDLGPLVERQHERLANDQVYPPALYVPQRYRLLPAPASIAEAGVQDDLLGRTTGWLDADSARLVMVLGDFGRGKTALLRQLARALPEELPGVLPVLVELRSLEKAPTLDGLLAQHLANQGVEDIHLGKLRYMIRSGRLALLFDGFDELELRVGYDNAADYLQTLLTSVTDRAKVVLTSRTQHFRNSDQVRTALGERVENLTASRVVVLEDFAPDQVLRFLTNLYGNEKQARARVELLGDIEDLLGLARNPRMLSFIADLEDDRLRAAQAERGKISAADLYREIIERWLVGEAGRHRHRRGLPTLDERERLEACAALALKLWSSTAPTIPAGDLSATVTAQLTRLSERGYSAAQAGHAIGSGSLLVRTDEGSFGFIHQSIMEWLVAELAARTIGDDSRPPIKSARRMSRLMTDFFIDLAGHDVARGWAVGVLTDPDTPEIAKQNALAVQQRVPTVVPTDREVLAGLNLRDQDLTGRNLRDADLRGANLRGMRLENVDFTGALLQKADFTGARLVGGSLRDAQQAGSRWDRAALLGVDGVHLLLRWPEVRAAAIAGHDPAEPMRRANGSTRAVEFSPDGILLAVARERVVEIVDVADGRPFRILGSHAGAVSDVAFSPDGRLLATASEDGTARIWDVATGTPGTTLTGHSGPVTAVAFSPDGTQLATASNDGTARIWDPATASTRATLTGHSAPVTAVAFSPDGTQVATASNDRTTHIWDLATGTTRATLTGHGRAVTAVAYSPDGTQLATASDDGSARIWDPATGTTRTTLTSNSAPVTSVGLSPDGTRLATASDDGTAHIWDLATGTTRALGGNYHSSVAAVAYSPDGTQLATAYREGTTRICDAATGTGLRTTLTGHNGPVNAIAYSPDGSQLATASDDRTTRLWDLATGTARTTLTGHQGWVNAVAYSPDGTQLATASHDGTARISELATGTTQTTLTGDGWGVSAVAYSPDGTLLATASGNGTARIWDLATGATRATLSGHDGWVNAVAFDQDGTLLATASDDGTARTWDVATGEQLTVLVPLPEGRSAAVFADGSYALEGDAGDDLWWAIKLCRFAPGELDPYVPGLRRRHPPEGT
jgi:WD40 repeat protein